MKEGPDAHTGHDTSVRVGAGPSPGAGLSEETWQPRVLPAVGAERTSRSVRVTAARYTVAHTPGHM